MAPLADPPDPSSATVPARSPAGYAPRMSETVGRIRLLALLGELTPNGPVELTPDRPLRELGIDSLGWAELAAAIQGEWGVDLAGLQVGPETRLGEVLRAVEGSDGPPAGPRPRLGRLQGTADVLGGRALRWWFRLQVEGAEHVPVAGPAVLAMNHESALDIPIIVTACPRRITFMAKRELYKNVFVSWALRQLGGFSVDRARFDLRAIDAALEAIGSGLIVGMYPEGTRSPGRLEPFLPGAGWLAVRTGAPLVPCSISGTDRARAATRPGRVRVRVRFHAPIRVEPQTDPGSRRRMAEELTRRLRREIGGSLPRAGLLGR